MTKIVADLILLFGGCIIASIFYWQIFYPLILKRIRFHLFEMRDQARSIAAERSMGNDFVFKEIERFVCNTIAIAPRINILSFLWFVSKRRNETDVTDYERFSKEAPEEFIRIREATARDAVAVMMINSPWEIFMVLFPLPLLWAAGKISRLSVYRKVEGFVENFQVETPTGLRAAC